MQLMPGTARQYGVRNSYDPKANLEAGVRHLKDLMSRLELPLALAAYNAGEGDHPALRRPAAVSPRPRTTSATSCAGSAPVGQSGTISRISPANWPATAV